MTNPDPNPRIVLLGLPADAAESLGHLVSKWGAVLYIPPLFPLHRSLALIRETRPRLVFVWTGESQGAFFLEALRKAEPKLEVVAVGPHVANRSIHTARDSGATDYGANPLDFSPIQGLPHATSRTGCC